MGNLITTANATLRPDSPDSGASGYYHFDCSISEIDTLKLSGLIPHAFEEFIASLPQKIKLRRGAFILAHRGSPVSDSTLSVIAVSDGEISCSGLGITIPQTKSMLQEICDARCLKTIVPASEFHGNFVERHALIVSPDGCLGMYPLEVNTLILGAVALNCDNYEVFQGSCAEIQSAIGVLGRRVAELAPFQSSDAPVSLDN